MSDFLDSTDTAYELRDLIADAIIEYETQHPGCRVVLHQEYSHDTLETAQIGQLAVAVVAPDGLDNTPKATTYRSLTRSDTHDES